MKSVTDDTASFQMNTAIAMPVGIVDRDDPMLQFDAQNEAALTPLAVDAPQLKVVLGQTQETR